MCGGCQAVIASKLAPTGIFGVTQITKTLKKTCGSELARD